MGTLESMRMFVRVAEAGSFTKAGALTGSTTAQVSRVVSSLEARLNTRLLNRTTRRLSLTAAGAQYLQQCQQILAAVDQAEAEAAGATTEVSGRLRVHGTTSFGQHYMAPLIARYHERYPDVRIDLVLAQRTPDIIEEGFDLSVVGAQELADSALVSQHIGSVRMLLCASPRYVARHGTPASLEALDTHRCLQFVSTNAPPGEWHLEADPLHELTPHAPPRIFRPGGPVSLTVNVAEALAEAIREGMGIGPLPPAVALPGLRDGSLVRVLPQYRLRPTHVYALYASRQYLDAKIRTFVLFLRDAVPHILSAQELELGRLAGARKPGGRAP